MLEGARAASWTTLALLAAAVFLARLAISMAMGWNIADEAWNLRVVQRFLAGDTLYRDIYFGVTPLPVYIASFACFLLGVQAVVLKALSAAAFAGIFLASYNLLRLAGSTVKPWPVALLIALVPAAPYTAALYNDLSPLSLLLVAAAALRWQKLPTLARALSLGVLLGVCFAAKQNTGMYAAPGVVAVILLSPAGTTGRRFGHLGVASAAAAGVVTLMLLPITLSGGWQDMIVQCFTNKSNYLRHSGLNFFDGFRALGSSVREFPEPRAVVTFFWSLIFPLAVMAPLALAIALARRPTRGALTVLPFLLAMAATIYPRAGVGNVARAFPAILIALVLAAPAFPRPVVRTVSAAGVMVAGVALAFLLLLFPWRVISRDYRFSALPHTRGVQLHVREHARLERLGAAVAAQPGPTFIFSTEAGALYLVSGIDNPTSNDYP